MVLRTIALHAAFALLGSCASEPVTEPVEDDFHRRIVDAAFADSKVWMVREDGSLSSLAEDDDAFAVHALNEPVTDICGDGARLWAVTGSARYTLRSWQNGRWQSVGQIDKGEDFILGLGCGPGGPLLVTNRALVAFDASGRVQTDLSNPIFVPEQVPGYGVVHATDEWVYVGLDAGEWGGGMRRIARRSGRVEAIERADGELCAGPLNSACDRVQAIAPIPWQPGCLAIAIDVGHGGEGRVTRVCHGGVEQILVARDQRLPPRPDIKRDWREGGYGSIPFLGAVASGEDLILAGSNGIYRMNSGGVAHLGWPEARTIGDVSVSFAIPGVVLLTQGWNAEYLYHETVRLIPRPR